VNLILALLLAWGLGDPDALRREVRRTFHVPDPLPPPAARGYSSFEVEPGVTADRVSYATEFGMRVPSIVYHPTRAATRRPALIIINGHGGDKYSWYSVYAGILFARAGAVVLTYDPIGEGERNAEHKNGTRAHDTYVPPDESGRWMGGLMMTDLMQAVSYLRGRPDVDPNRIGATGYSMGSFVLSLGCAVETRLSACAPVAGGYLDGPGGNWDTSTKRMCQAIPYQSLLFLGDRAAVLFSLSALHARMLIHNGSTDDVVKIEEHGPDFFRDMRERTVKMLGRDTNVFTYSFTSDGGHRPYFITRPVAVWLNEQLHFPSWKAISDSESHISEWAARRKAPMDPQYATEHREGGTIALGQDIPWIEHDKLNVMPEADWNAVKRDFVMEAWFDHVKANGNHLP
jgi:dienelactone hydrolase